MQKYLILGLIIALYVCTAPVAAWEDYNPLTQGYWKNHPEDWPSPMSDDGDYDDNFFYSGQNWMTVLQKAPKGGNAYYLLAHQYIAAVLNMYSGSWAPYTKLDEAAKLLDNQDNTPAKIGALKGNDPLRQQFIDLAAYLDDYNNRRLKE